MRVAPGFIEVKQVFWAPGFLRKHYWQAHFFTYSFRFLSNSIAMLVTIPRHNSLRLADMQKDV